MEEKSLPNVHLTEGLTCRIDNEIKILNIKKTNNLVNKCTVKLHNELLKEEIQIS